MVFWRHIEDRIEEVTGQAFQLRDNQGVGGGSINRACRLSDGQRAFFLKTNHLRYADMFVAEARGLEALAKSRTVRVPGVICYGKHGDQCYLIMEYLDISGRANMALFGQQLAAMHQVIQPEYGWEIDNTIGSTPQPNTPSSDWIHFWREHRLGFQLKLAERNGYRGALINKGERLLEVFPALFETYQPKPSMLHGDLWSGNYGGLKGGEPVIFDPAFYYGDREADLAMTTLFGNFGSAFYAAYNEAWPLDEGYSVRKTFYNSYHIINHLNLFGGGYLGQAVSMIEEVLSQIH